MDVNISPIRSSGQHGPGDQPGEASFITADGGESILFDLAKMPKERFAPSEKRVRGFNEIKMECRSEDREPAWGKISLPPDSAK